MMNNGVGPLRPYEKWFYPSLLLWVSAAVWVGCVVWPSRPFTSMFDLVVANILTVAAAVTGVVALVLSRRP